METTSPITRSQISYSNNSPREIGASDTKPSTSGPEFWKETADAVENANSSKLLDTFAGIHPIVTEASKNALQGAHSQIANLKTRHSEMKAQNQDPSKVHALETAIAKMETLQTELRTEAGDYPRWSAELEAARSAKPEEFSKVKQSFVHHTEQLTSRIDKLSSTTKDAWAAAGVGAGTGAAMGISYGGATGNEIFKTMNSTYIVPMMQSLIETFSAETHHLTYGEQLQGAQHFLNQFLNRAGDARNTIAHLSGSASVQDFGRRRTADDPPMRDTCDASTFYKPWKSHITNKASTLVFAHSAVQQWRANGGANRPLSDFVNETGASHNATRTIELIANGIAVGLSVDSSTQPPTCRGTMFGSPANCSVAHYEFDWSEHPDGYLVLSNLICEHATLANNDIPSDAAEDMVAIATWRKGGNIDLLRDSIASFAYKVSNSSTYFRGQAAILEEMLKAIQRAKGVEIKLVDSIVKPHPTIDQQALSTPYREQFIASMREQISIRELPSD